MTIYDPPTSRCRGMTARCLVDSVAREIIPHLLRKTDGGGNGPGAGSVAIADCVAALARYAVRRDVRQAETLIEDLRLQGANLDEIYLDLLAGTAHHLGRQWEDDEITFADVSLGLCTLHQILYRLSPRFREGRARPDDAGRVLLAAAPGEKHFFGAMMIADFFARAGWHVWTEADSSPARLGDLVRQEGFDVVGLSLNCDRNIETTEALIVRIRSEGTSDVIVGGRAAALAEGRHLGADHVATSAANGLSAAQHLLSRRRARPDRVASAPANG